MKTVCQTSICEKFQNAISFFTPKNIKECTALGLIASTALASTGIAIAGTVCFAGYKWAKAKPLENPNEVCQIYTPPRSDHFDYSPYLEQIDKLKKDPTIIGIALAKKKDNSLHPIYVKKMVRDPFTIKFLAYDLTDNSQLGFAITHPFLPSNQYLQSYWLMGRPDNYLGYGSDPTEVSKVLIEQVENDSSEFKNIGVILLKGVLQAFPDCENRVIFDSVRNTGPYYYRQGYRISNPSKQHLNITFAKIAQRKGEIERSDLGSHTMYLPNQARQLWTKEIAENPVAFPKQA